MFAGLVCLTVSLYIYVPLDACGGVSVSMSDWKGWSPHVPAPSCPPSINLQHASQSKHCHSVIVEKPQHTAPYINTLFSQPCQNKGCVGRKTYCFFGGPLPRFGAISEQTFSLPLSEAASIIHEDKCMQVLCLLELLQS